MNKDLNEFLGYDPESVDKLNETLNDQPLNRTIGASSSQSRPRSKKHGSGKVIDKGVSEKALEAIKKEIEK